MKLAGGGKRARHGVQAGDGAGGGDDEASKVTDSLREKLLRLGSQTAEHPLLSGAVKKLVELCEWQGEPAVRQ